MPTFFEDCVMPNLEIPNGFGYGNLHNCLTSIQIPKVNHSCQIEFKCHYGYIMKGNPTITCENGQWLAGEEGQPKCKMPHLIQ